MTVSYAPDVFGGVRREVEASAAQAEVAAFQREAAYLTLTANVVAAAIQEASLRAQVQATHEAVAVASRLLAAVRKQRQAGQLGAADVAAQESALAQIEATLPPLEKQLALQRDLITVLAGRFPSETITQTFEPGIAPAAAGAAAEPAFPAGGTAAGHPCGRGPGSTRRARILAWRPRRGCRASR